MILKKRYNLLIILILILALLLMIYNLSAKSIWFDEAFSIYHAQQSLLHIVTLNEPTPPLYLIILNLFIKVFGMSEFVVRLPSVIFGVLSVFLIYILGRNLFEERIGLYASLVLALSTFHIFHSQNARTYTLLGFLSLASMYFFIRYVKSGKGAIAYVLSTVLLMYSHFFGFFVVIVQNVFYISQKITGRRIGKTKKWLILQAVIFLLYLPEIYFFIAVLTRQITNNIGWITIGMSLEGLQFIALYFGGATIYLLHYFLRHRNEFYKIKRNLLLLVLWVIIPVIIPVVYSFVIKPIFVVRYVIFCFFPVYLLIAFSLNTINKYLRLIVLTLFVIVSSYYLYQQAEGSERTEWRVISDYVSSISDKEDVVIIEPGYMLLPFFYYHNPDCFRNPDIFECASEEGTYTIWKAPNEISYVNNTNRIIYIWSFWVEETPTKYFEFLRNRYNILSVKRFIVNKYGGTSVYMLSTNKTSSIP